VACWENSPSAACWDSFQAVACWDSFQAVPCWDSFQAVACWDSFQAVPCWDSSDKPSGPGKIFSTLGQRLQPVVPSARRLFLRHQETDIGMADWD
jgi:hypothetical protein